MQSAYATAASSRKIYPQALDSSNTLCVRKIAGICKSRADLLNPYSPPSCEETVKPHPTQDSIPGPTLVEFLISLFMAIVFSFRFIGVFGLFAFLVVMTKSQNKKTQWVAFYVAFGLFLLPIDVRTTNTIYHRGEPDTFISILPVFTANNTAHSSIRERYSEYYTSHAIYRPLWVISIDVGKT